jgi:hypothetical protein
VKLSVKLLRVTDPVLPFLTGNPLARTLLLAQFSVKPWALDGEVVLRELRSFLSTASVDDALRVLAEGPNQDGAVSTLARRRAMGHPRPRHAAAPGATTAGQLPHGRGRDVPGQRTLPMLGRARAGRQNDPPSHERQAGTGTGRLTRSYNSRS